MSRTKLKSSDFDSSISVNTLTIGSSLLDGSGNPKVAAGVVSYATIDDLPLTGMAEPDMALVLSTKKLYIWIDSGSTHGWYNIEITQV